MNTTVELHLSPAYKRCQRSLASWIDMRNVNPQHQSAFHLRASLRLLDAAEQARLARWLAWLSYGAERQGNPGLVSRIHKLDRLLGWVAGSAGARLPGARMRIKPLRRSA